MTKTYKGGYIGGSDRLRAPNAPTISTTKASEQVSVTITDPSDTGGGDVTTYNATASFTVGSTEFDGTGDYLQGPSSSDFSFGTGDFTIECFFNRDVTGGLFQLSANSNGYSTSTSDSLAIGIAGSPNTGKIRIYSAAGGNDLTSTIPSADVWHHIAMVRNTSDDTLKIYLDGTLIHTVSSETTNYTYTYLAIGIFYSTSYPLNGHISNFRILKGTALYTSDFTAPTSPLEDITNTSILTCVNHSGTILDMSSKKHSITASGNSASSADHPFGNIGSTEFDGTGDYLQLPNSSDWDFGTGDFTIEAFVYFDNTSENTSRGGLWQLSLHSTGLQNSNTGNIALGVYKSSGTGHWYMYAGSGSHDSGVNFSEGKWYHVAQVRSSGTTKLYVDGTEIDTLSDSVDYDGTYGIIGGYYSTSYLLEDAHLSNFRVLKGTALYTSAFTPPNAPLEEITNTKILTCTNTDGTIKDISSNNHTITTNGDPTASTGLNNSPPGNTPYLTTGATGSSSPVTITGLINNASYSVVGSVGNAYGVSPISAASSVTPSATRGIFYQGTQSAGNGISDVIEYITIDTAGNATDFGDATKEDSDNAGLASSTRGVVAGGYATDVIEYVTILSLGNGADFGDLSANRLYIGAFNNTTRGVFTGGSSSGATNQVDIMEYITIASLGDVTDFGNLSVARYGVSGTSSGTRGITCGGRASSSYKDEIDYITIASLGNAADFGNLSQARTDTGSVCSGTRAVTAGGDPNGSSLVDVMDYVTIASAGNSTDFGNLTAAIKQLAGSNSATRGCFAGGRPSSGFSDVIQYITITSTGNTADFGDLTVQRAQLAGFSNGNGGLQ